MSGSVEDHGLALLLRQRCPACAEVVAPAVALHAQPCPACGTRPLALAGLNITERLDKLADTWRARRPWIYGLTALGAALGGTLPLVAALATLGGLVAARFGVLQPALRWLSPQRRVLTGLAVRLWLLAVAGAALVLHEILTLLPGIGLLLHVVVALAATLAYVEGALVVVRDRLRRDQRGPRLDTWEWALPAGLALTSAALTAVGVMLAIRLVQWLQEWGGALLDRLPRVLP